MDDRVEDWVEQQFVEAQCAREGAVDFDLADHLRRSFEAASTTFDPEQAADAHHRLQQRLAAYDRVLGACRVLQGLDEARRDAPVVLPGFVVEEEVGRGGMGRVFRARHLGRNCEVAIKVPLFQSSLTERDRQRWQRETEAVARLDHPGIVRLLESSTYEGTPCLVMEFVDGVPLTEVLAAVRGDATTLAMAIARPELDHVHAACEIARLLLQAIDAAHLAGVVHRDLKPSNVMLDRSGRVRILDFGLARLDGDGPVTRTGEIVGTPQYLPPELLSNGGGLLGPWTDTYGVGVVLFEMLALQHPFHSPTAEQTIARIAAGDATPLRRVARHVPVGIASVVEKSLCPDPRARYATAEAFLEDLARAVDDGRPMARPVTTLTRWWRRARRRPGLVVTVVVMATVTITAATLSVRGELARQRNHEAFLASTLQGASAALEVGATDRAQDALLAVAEAISAERTPASTRGEYQRLVDGVALAHRLERVWSAADSLPAVVDGYRTFFREQFGALEPTTVAGFVTAVRAHPHRERIVQALHDWGMLASAPDQGLLMQVVEAVDREPLRQRIREAAAAHDRERLAQLGEQLEPAKAGWHLSALLASAFESVGDVGAAENVLSRATLRFPNQVLLHYQLADLLTKHAGTTRTATILAALEAAAHLRPRDAEANSRLVRALLGARELDRALLVARRGVERMPDDYPMLLALAEAQSVAEQTEPALASLQRAQVLAATATERAEVHNRRGYVLLCARRGDESLAAYEAALACVPDDLRAMRQVVVLCMVDNRDVARARELLVRCLALAPDDCYLLGFQSKMLEAAGDLPGALRCVERIMGLDPQYYVDLYTELWSAAELALRASGEPACAAADRAKLCQQALRWAEDSVDHAARALFANEVRAPLWSRRAKDWLQSRAETKGFASLRDPEQLAKLPAEDAARARDLWRRAAVFASFQGRR